MGRYVEDYEVGEAFVTRSHELTEDEVVSFAQSYDPQPIHTDKEYAETGPFGGLIASGFQTVALAFTLWVELGHLKDVSLGGPGMDEVRWLKPVYAGDRVTAHITILEARVSKSKPDRGLVVLGFELTNQKDEIVLTWRSLTMVKSRP